ncbi:MAG: DUF1320 domain-containing protein [Sulfurimicrobium sp.]|nr:DUF1320 domain-containing protein [Sulfurimicrobium sp.]
MTYATLPDLVARYGEDELVKLTDTNRSGVIDAGVLGQAIADADSEIDSYLAVRYSLPLASVPTALKRIACDITRYRLYDNRAPEEIRKRYEDAVKWLAAVANGSVGLGMPPAQAPAQSGGVMLIAGEARRCSRTTLEDF